MKIKPYLKIVLIIFLTTGIIYSQTTTLLQSKLDGLLSDEFFESTLIAVDIFDLQSREVLYQKNNKQLLHPASNMKILTSAAGLVFLEPEYEFRTSLYYTGVIVNETLYGDLYIVGGCDPDFTSKDLDSLIKEIDFLGIKEISGNIYGDVSMIDSLFWGEGWMWDDDPAATSPYLTPLNINDNAIGIAVKGIQIGNKAAVYLKPETGFVEILNKTETVSSLLEDTYSINRDWLNRKNTFIVEGKVMLDEAAVSENDFNYFNLFRPENYFLTLFFEALLRQDIKFNNQILFSSFPSTAVHLFTFTRIFDTVIVNLNKTSDNLSAEMTLYALGEKFYNEPATAKKGIRIIDSLIILSGLDPNKYRLVDGSGVSHYNLVSTELILNILKYMYYQQPELFEILYESFPVAGIDGTLRSRMQSTAAENNVHAKTGTLSGVSALSGYVTGKNNHLLAFSILIQNHVRNTSRAIHFQNEICRILAEYE